MAEGAGKGAGDETLDLPVPQDCKRCLGMLYYSQSLFETKKGPRCVGLRRTLEEDEALGSAGPGDALPSGDFRYVCVGCAEYDMDTLRRAAGRGAGVSVADVPLPRCIGIEAIASSAAAKRPDVLVGGAGGLGAGGDEDPTAGARGGKTSSRASAPPSWSTPTQPESDLRRFLERFQAHSARIAGRMVTNANAMAATVQRGIDAVVGGGDDDGKPQRR